MELADILLAVVLFLLVRRPLLALAGWLIKEFDDLLFKESK